MAAMLCLLARGAGAAFGTTGALILAEGLAVRPLGLAGAYTALADDEASQHVNPAGLARVEGLQVGGGHGLGLLDERLSYLDLAWRPGRSLGLGLRAAHWGGQDQIRDAFGQELGSLNNQEVLLGLSLGAALASGWRLGLGLSAVQSDYGGRRLNSLAGDLGLQAELPRGFRFGAALLNAGRSFDADELPTPLRVRAGLAHDVFTPSWQLEADIEALPVEEQGRLLLGTEYRFAPTDAAADPGDRRGESGRPVLSLRAGVAVGLLQAEDARLSLGAGVALPPLTRIDYALLNLGPLGPTHRLSLSLSLARSAPPGPPGARLKAPYGLTVTAQNGGLVLQWQDANEAVAGYNVYSDYGVVVERLNPSPLDRPRQRFIKVTRSRTYNFYVRPVGSDGKEGPSSEVKTVRVK
jgi:hypothetical protein